MAGRALLLGPPDRTLQGGEPAGDNVGFVVAERPQEGPLGREAGQQDRIASRGYPDNRFARNVHVLTMLPPELSDQRPMSQRPGTLATGCG